MGVVYAAYDPQLDRKIAIKLLRPRTASDGVEWTSRLLREAQDMARLAHPNVVSVFESGLYVVQLFLAMVMVEGGNRPINKNGEEPAIVSGGEAELVTLLASERGFRCYSPEPDGQSDPGSRRAGGNCIHVCR